MAFYVKIHSELLRADRALEGCGDGAGTQEQETEVPIRNSRDQSFGPPQYRDTVTVVASRPQFVHIRCLLFLQIQFIRTITDFNNEQEAEEDMKGAVLSKHNDRKKARTKKTE